VQVVTQACHGLVECIERGELHALSTKLLLQGYLQPLLDAGADTIVLGCTHYPFVRPLIEELLQENITANNANDIVLIDTGAAVARHLKHRLEEKSLIADATGAATVRFWSNSPAQDAQQVVAKLWDEDVELTQLS
jgi:glutamate racemase